MSVRLAIYGAAGRMGRAVAEVATADPDIELVAALEHDGSEHLGTDVGELLGGKASGVTITGGFDTLAVVDVVIDFTTPDGTRRLLGECAERGVPAVVGTTGLGSAVDDALASAERTAPIVVAPNMSVGVTLLFHLARLATKGLGPDFDAEIVEMHHKRKVDAPSGTAVRLASVVARAKGLDPRQHVIHGRSGQVGARPREEVGVMTLRGGDVVGEHTLYLAGPGERLELTHRATDRTIFARGAIRAARWVIGRDPGRYDMTDVLGFGNG